MCVHLDRRHYNVAAELHIRTVASNLFDLATSIIVRKQIRLGQRLIVDGAAWVRFPAEQSEMQ